MIYIGEGVYIQASQVAWILREKDGCVRVTLSSGHEFMVGRVFALTLLFALKVEACA